MKENMTYYQSLISEQYRYYICPQKKILQIGCGSGHLLNTLEPSLGVGIDKNESSIAMAKNNHPNLSFQAGELADLKTSEKFDYIILSGLLGHLSDIQEFLTLLKGYCTNDTRIIIEFRTYFWEVLLQAWEQLSLKPPKKFQNWLTAQDIYNFLDLTGYQPVKLDKKILFPYNVPILSPLINKIIANLPLINAFTLNHFIIARPLLERSEEFSVTILVPCRNEKGNIENAVARTPIFGTKQEFIFVEGNSKDGTYEEVERIIKKYPDKNIKLYKQPGKGKGDAVRFGFDKAQCDILMILDADLTVAPEDLPKFYDVLKENKGEFINGCRLVYPMEKEAMRFLNLIANKFFGLFFSWLLGQRFRDTLCGTKVLLKKHYIELVRNRSYFGDFDPFGDFDLIFGASKLNLRIIELPISYKERRYGETQIQRFRHGLLLFQMCGFAMKKIKFR